MQRYLNGTRQSLYSGNFRAPSLRQAQQASYSGELCAEEMLSLIKGADLTGHCWVLWVTHGLCRWWSPRHLSAQHKCYPHRCLVQLLAQRCLLCCCLQQHRYCSHGTRSFVRGRKSNLVKRTNRNKTDIYYCS